MQVTNRDSYDLYRKKRRKVAKEIDQYKLYVKAVNGLLSCLLEMVKEAESGVYIKGLGYFFHNKSDKLKKGIHGSFFTRMKKRYTYSMDFYPDNELSDWYITFTSDVNYKKKEYTVYFDTVDSISELDTVNNKIKRLPKIAKHLL